MLLFQRVRNGGVVGEVPAGWAARVSLLQRSAGQDCWDSLIQIPQPERPTSGHVSILCRYLVQHLGGSAGTAITRVKRIRKSLVILFG